MACQNTSPGTHSKKSDCGDGSWDEVTMRLLLYCLHTRVMVLFTPELQCRGLIGNVQSRRLLINAVSGFWHHKQTMT